MSELDYLGAGKLIVDRISETVPAIKRVEELGDLMAMLESDAEEMAKQLSGMSPAVFVGYDGESPGQHAGDSYSHVAIQHWLIVLTVRNLRKADTNKGVIDQAGPLMAAIVQSLSGWKPQGYTTMQRQAAPRPGYRAGVGFFPLMYTTSLFIPDL